MANTQDLHRRITQAIVAKVGGDIKGLADRAKALEDSDGVNKLGIAALIARAAAAEARTQELSGRLDTASSVLRQLATRTSQLETAMSAVMSMRSALITLPLLNVGGTEVKVAWSTPFADATYGVSAIVEAGALALGRLTAGLKANSLTPSECIIVLTNSAVASIQAGATLHVLAWRNRGAGE